MKPRHNNLDVIPALGRAPFTWRFFCIHRTPTGEWRYDEYPMGEHLLVAVSDRHFMASAFMGQLVRSWRGPR
jgi:hypothetical protein